MHYYLYEIKNNLNGKIYVGVHKAKSMDDGYMGSGKILKSAIAKHGEENFTKTILETFDSLEAMYAREKEVVNEEFLARDDVYNLRRGGFGGFDHINQNGLNLYGSNYENLKPHVKDGANTKARMLERGTWEDRNKKLSASISKKYENGFVNPFKGRNHSVEDKQRIGYKNSRHQKGDKNSQFGSMWITNGEENRKIKKEDVIPEGWRKGRITRLKL